ncbi:MAG: bis(5'-nucleosyl)-tetraphosphatase [Acholeplasmataceae bacterium]
MIKEHACGAVIYRKQDEQKRYVVIKQKHGNHYGFPKGHMEKDEDEVMTAYREVSEETGLDVFIIPNVRAESTYSPRFRVKKKVTYFLAEARTAKFKPQHDEVTEILWLSEEEALKKLTYPIDRDILKMMVEYLERQEDA